MNSIIKRSLMSVALALLMIPFINFHSIMNVNAKQRPRISDITRNKNYGFISNYGKDLQNRPPYNYYRTAKGNDHVAFSHPLFLHYRRYVKSNYGYKHGDPQSMAILPDGKLYVLFNAGHGDSSLNRIFKYNLTTGRLLNVGRIFRAGHGQGLSYDYKGHTLWMCMNRYHNKNQRHGIVAKALRLKRVNQNSLLPYGHTVNVRSYSALGDNFAYDKSGYYWNVARNYVRNKLPLDSLQIYKGHHGKLRLVRDLLHSSSACIQNLCYNPDTNRLYVVGNGCLLSFPAKDINHLNNHEIRVAIMNHHSEFEGMGFWHH